MQDIQDRLSRIEERLTALESRLGLGAQPATKTSSAGVRITSPVTRPGLSPDPAVASESITATQIMAWAAGFTLLLAAVYFLKLIYDAGWLTPARQLGLAGLSGVLLIAAGIHVARYDRAYAAYLPALGLVILYLTLYVGHLYYLMISMPTALMAAGIVSLTGVWLGRRFNNSVFVIFAATGVYVAPLLISTVRADLIGVVVYYSVWSLLFSFFALQEGRRITYILPMFYALLGFDIVWRITDQNAWVLAASYQFVQFLIFSATAAIFSIVHRKPMDELQAYIHGFALIYFYALEYIILRQHLPIWAPRLGLGSAVLVYAIYFIAEQTLKGRQSLRFGAMIVSGYCTIVTVHTVFFEMLPSAWLPWAVMVLPVLALLLAPQFKENRTAFQPILMGVALLFVYGYIRLMFVTHGHSNVYMPNLALLFYAFLLYGAYFHLSRKLDHVLNAPLVLYAGHLAFMVCIVRYFDSGLVISLVWAALAVVVLIIALKTEDKIIGQSALLIFSASGVKVLLFDLSGSGSITRVITLIMLGVSLYVGGWLYQSLVRGVRHLHDNPAVNRQLNMIRRMVQDGLMTPQILSKLKADKVEYLGEGEWSAEVIDAIIRDYNLDAERP